MFYIFPKVQYSISIIKNFNVAPLAHWFAPSVFNTHNQKYFLYILNTTLNSTDTHISSTQFCEVYPIPNILVFPKTAQLSYITCMELGVIQDCC